MYIVQVLLIILAILMFCSAITNTEWWQEFEQKRFNKKKEK